MASRYEDRPSRAKRMLAEGNWFARRALDEGITLFDRDEKA